MPNRWLICDYGRGGGGRDGRAKGGHGKDDSAGLAEAVVVTIVQEKVRV